MAAASRLPTAWKSRALEYLLVLRRIDPPRQGKAPLARIAAERSVIDQQGRAIRVYDVETQVRSGTRPATFITRFYIDYTGAIVRHEPA